MITYDDIDFVIVGPGHSGSTWLRNNLAKISGIHIPYETNYLTWLSNRGVDLSVYYPDKGDPRNSIIYGEHANTYFSHPAAPSLMRKENHDCKFVIMVKDPVDLVEKYYRHDLRWGFYPPFSSISAACEHDAYFERYIGTASYYRNMTRWLLHFPPERFFIFNSDTKDRRREEVFLDLLNFLSVPQEIPEGFHSPVNVSRFTLWPSLHRYATFGADPLLRRICRTLDPLNRLMGKLAGEPTLSDDDRAVVKEALGLDASLDRFLEIARAKGLRGIDFFPASGGNGASAGSGGRG